MSERFADRRALRDKIEWEGGLIDSLEYGIGTTDMPEGDTELTEAWTRLADAWRALEPFAEAVQDMLDAVGDDREDELL